jgi:hypothetical protein
MRKSKRTIYEIAGAIESTIKEVRAEGEAFKEDQLKLHELLISKCTYYDISVHHVKTVADWHRRIWWHVGEAA